MAKSIGIAAVFRPDQRAGGVYSFVENLLRGFDDLLDSPQTENPFELTVFHGSVASANAHDRIHRRCVSTRFGRFAAETSIAMIAGGELDGLLFPNYFTPPLVRAKRAVTVIHDLQYLHMPEFYRRTKRLWLRSCHAVTLRKCHRVVAISHAVKQDLLRLYGSRWSDKIEVIWNPVSLSRFDGADTSQITGGRPYILTVSVDRPQKNLFRLIKAFARVRAKFPDYCLVVAGQLRSLRRDRRERSGPIGKAMPAAADLVEELGLGDHVHVTGFISDQQLGALYRGATMCVLPSLFEGFGMPAVESLAMGKPTLVSGLPVLREVTLDAAQYLDDPTNVDSMAEKIIAMLDRPESYRPTSDLIDRIRNRFAPAEIARQYLNVLTA